MNSQKEVLKVPYPVESREEREVFKVVATPSAIQFRNKRKSSNAKFASGKFYSAFASDEMSAVYDIGVKTHAYKLSSGQRAYLYGFDTLTNAVYFVVMCSLSLTGKIRDLLKERENNIDIAYKFSILKCRAMVVDIGNVLIARSSVSTKAIKGFWNKHISHWEAMEAPDGSIYCEWIEPYELMSIKDIRRGSKCSQQNT